MPIEQASDHKPAKAETSTKQGEKPNNAETRSQPWKKTLDQVADRAEGDKEHDFFDSKHGFYSQTLAA